MHHPKYARFGCSVVDARFSSLGKHRITSPSHLGPRLLARRAWHPHPQRPYSEYALHVRIHGHTGVPGPTPSMTHSDCRTVAWTSGRGPPVRDVGRRGRTSREHKNSEVRTQDSGLLESPDLTSASDSRGSPGSLFFRTSVPQFLVPRYSAPRSQTRYATRGDAGHRARGY